MSAKFKKKPKSKPKKSKAEERQEHIVKVVTAYREDGNELFHTPDDKPWARIQVNGHFENLPIIKNDRLESLCVREVRKLTGIMPPKSLIADLLRQLEGHALFDGPERHVSLRVAEHGGSYYLDLCDAEWRCIEITPYGGWKVISNPPVRFRRSEGLESLPVPVHGGSIGELFDFINVEKRDHRILLLAWLIAAYRPTSPYPILALHGQQGSAKSTTQTVLRRLVDPSLRSAPRDARDLAIAASHAHFLSFDNFSAISSWLSEDMCRLATGGSGFTTRQLYSDQKQIIFSGQRPIMLNGIEDLAERADLLERMLVLHLPKIRPRARQPEQYLWEKFAEAQPRILGALLDAVCSALRRLAYVMENRKKLIPESPRMADFALWAVAAEEALGFEPGEFLTAYSNNREELSFHALEMSPATAALVRFIRSYREPFWEGTHSELLQRLNNTFGSELRAPQWPKSGIALSAEIKRAIPNLGVMGISVESLQREPGTGQRRIRVSRHSLQNSEEFAEKTVTSSQAGEDAAAGKPN